MATYVIEGTISELRKEGQSCIRMKIAGSEGYSVKQDKKKYNVFRYQDLQNNNLPTTGKVAPCYIADSQFELPIGVGYENILVQALVSGKRVRLTILESILKSAVQSNAGKTSQNQSASSGTKSKGDGTPQDQGTNPSVPLEENHVEQNASDSTSSPKESHEESETQPNANKPQQDEATSVTVLSE
ncbi:MAG: hypothetical protein J1E59_09830 [Treponema sp.]|nr:hypothetical protein [Treponema sp.]